MTRLLEKLLPLVIIIGLVFAVAGCGAAEEPAEPAAPTEAPAAAEPTEEAAEPEEPMPEAEGLQTNNPGFPGYDFGGFSLIGSASLTYLF